MYAYKCQNWWLQKTKIIIVWSWCLPYWQYEVGWLPPKTHLHWFSWTVLIKYICKVRWNIFENLNERHLFLGGYSRLVLSLWLPKQTHLMLILFPWLFCCSSLQKHILSWHFLWCFFHLFKPLTKSPPL